MALLAASSSIACTSVRCVQAPSAVHLARSSVSASPAPSLPSSVTAASHGSNISDRRTFLPLETGASALAASLFASLAAVDSAAAAQEVMTLAADDNRGLALLLPLVPAVAWVLFNILQPALNQLDKMRSAKALAAGLGLGAAAALMVPPSADAAVQELADLAADSDSRGLLVLLVLVPAVGWVLFNILKPALNQLDKMRSAKGLVGAVGISTALLLSTDAADAAEAAGGSDARGLLLAASLVPALGWVLFNILQPALNQLEKMKVSKGLVAAVGLGAAGALLPLRSDAAEEIAAIAAATDTDNRGTLLLAVLVPAVGWVLYNILQPALNQLDKMRVQK